MNSSDFMQVLSRLPDDEFFDRRAEMEQIRSLAAAQSASASERDSQIQDAGSGSHSGSARRAKNLMRRASNVLVLGAPRSGKTEILRKSFDLLFGEGSDVAPIYYAFRAYSLDAKSFARDYLSQFLAQFIAFRRNDPRLIATADEPLAAIARAAPPEDYLWVRGIIDSFGRAAQSGDPSLLLRCALSAPMIAASRTRLAPFIMLDNFHLLADVSAGPETNAAIAELRSEFFRAMAANSHSFRAMGGSSSGAPVYVLCGLRRALIELMPPDEELFGNLEMIRVEPMTEEPLELMIRSTAARLGIEISDSTTELMVQQLNRDAFYIRTLLDAAASRGSSFRTFMEFERVYTEEVLNGRIGHYLGALLRDIAPEPRARRAVLEALALVMESSAAVPIEAVIERMGEYAADSEILLARLHAREFLEINYGFVNASPDTVLADYVRARYRSEIAGARRPVAGEELLGEKLKHSYRLMMSRYNRSIEAQLVELLSGFDFQSAPVSLLDLSVFDRRYRGMSRVQARRSLDEDQERVRLPQIVLVNSLGSGEQPGVSWRLFTASGFEGGIYSEANEVVWLIALVNSKEPLDVETLNRIDQRLESAARGARSNPQARLVRWYISKESFSAVASERLTSMRAYRSTYSQLDLLYDYIVKLAASEAERQPISEFELVIPIEADAELIAARTVEQIARMADFDQEAINQIKTALIEACLNAAEHGDSPDRRIYQKFSIGEDRITVTVSNKGKAFGSTEGDGIAAAGVPSVTELRGRGLHIIRRLMDEVRFERTDDGTSLVMTKLFKRPQ